MRRILLRAILGLGLALPALPLHADLAGLSPEQMVIAGGRALSLDKPDAALAIAEALLARDADDIQAHLLKSRALRDLGRYEPAADSAGAAWDLARTETEKFGAAMAMAQATASAGRRGQAQLWLRRAYENAATDGQRTLAKRDFRYVRARNPWRFRFSAGAVPSSNVNGGSNKDTITLFGLPFDLSPDAQALSGYQASASGALSYRFAEGDNWQTSLGAEAYTRRTWLSAAAQAAAPTAQGSDFDYRSLALTLKHEVLGSKPGREYVYSAHLGRNWYGGAHLSDFTSLRAQATLPGTAGRRFVLTARGDLQDNANPAAPVLALADLGGSYLQPLSGGHAVRYSLSLQQSFSADPTREHKSVQIGFEYFPGTPVLGADISLGATMVHKDFAVSNFSTSGRHDARFSVFADLRFENLSTYGFSPVVTLRQEKTRSNIALYSSDAASIELGFRSDF